MLSDTPGLHHVTGIVRNGQATHDFYAGVLGLRLVLQTVNRNDRFTRHLFYGDETGSPGSVLTFFPYPGAEDGRPGTPQIHSASLVVPPGSIPYWESRLRDAGRSVEGPIERLEETVLRVTDPDGTQLELVTGASTVEPLADGAVPSRHAVRGLHGVTLLPTAPYATASTLETLGFDLVGQAGERVRYEADGDRATVVDLLDRDAPYGREGAGSIQHVAVRVPDTEALYDWHELFYDREGYDVSRVVDRQFFHSLYVRDPGGILFELATDGPGLRTGAAAETPPTALYLPPEFEADRATIESQLPPLAADGEEHRS